MPVPTPCVGCRFATWEIVEEPRWGRCMHPVAVEARRPKPMVVFESGHTIVMDITSQSHLTLPPVCIAREPEEKVSK